eukprot:CAMPEP_0118651718 /NCGR_PEP_ID=MMETSP0785-20121206/10931_1 /TAXON_ID=91992 /ORGANISM="Bolidomonas pacifica, Strain CCMP 1866" /LENGTH=672 /DNA_ID=CAMNT_0006544181 /DNA_START=147 /DNA_END=2163 /DNA_ORIENTATION=-
MPSTPLSVTSFTSTPIALRSGATICATSQSSDSIFTLSTDGYLSGMWVKSGSLKTSFGEGGFVDTKSKYNTTVEIFTDDYGSGSILTGGGYDIMGSPGADVPLQQGVIKQWDLVRGTNVATYIGGGGLVRCIGVPGVTSENVATTVPLKEEEVEDDGKEDGKGGEGKEEKDDEDDDPYADDPTFNPNADDEEKARKEKERAKKRKAKQRINSHKLTAFVSGGDDVNLRFWDCTRKALVAEFIEEGLGAMKNIATCEGRPAVVLSGHRAGPGSTTGTVCVWDINGRVCMNKLEGVHVSEVAAMALSHCGTKLFTAGGTDDPTMKEWDMRMMRKVKNVGYHEDRIITLGLLTKPNHSFLFSASKDNSVGVSSITKSGVIKSKLVAEITDFQGLNNSISLGPMKLGDVSFAGGQKRKSKPDIYTVSADNFLRLYDMSDVISLDSASAPGVQAGVEKDVAKMKLSAEDNDHAKQTEFWDSFPSSEDVHGETAAKVGMNMTGKKKTVEKAVDNVKRDKYGNEVGSIEYWVAKGNEPKRPKVGDIVVLAGDNEDVDYAGVEITEQQKNVLKAMAEEKADKLPDEAKQMSLKFNRGDLGIIISDDNSGVPFEVLGALTGEKGWFEEDWIEVANLETIKKAKKENDISVANLKAGEVAKKEEYAGGSNGEGKEDEEEEEE